MIVFASIVTLCPIELWKRSSVQKGALCFPLAIDISYILYQSPFPTLVVYLQSVISLVRSWSQVVNLNLGLAWVHIYYAFPRDLWFVSDQVVVDLSNDAPVSSKLLNLGLCVLSFKYLSNQPTSLL